MQIPTFLKKLPTGPVHTFESFEEAMTKLERYVKYYNKVRIHGSLGYLLPPVEIRL